MIKNKQIGVVMRKYLKYIVAIVILSVVYIGGGKVLDRMYLNKYHIVDYTGQTRYSTVNRVIDKRFKKADEAIIINTNMIDHAVSVANYAYQLNIPVFYTMDQKLSPDTYKEIEKLGIKKIRLVGGTRFIDEKVERSFKRNGYKVSRIIEIPKVDMSIKMADMTYKVKKFTQIAVVTRNEMDLPNAVSFSPISQARNIPIITIDNNKKDISKLEALVKRYDIKKVYLIGNNSYINPNIDKLLKTVVKINGKDRYDVNRKIIDEFFVDGKNDKIYLSKAGVIMHKRHIEAGQLINAMAISPLAADTRSALLFINEDYFNTEESKLIKDKGYKEINEVGFKIKRRAFFNVERFRLPSTIALILISIIIASREVKIKGKKDINSI
ncbi:putative cell wall binding repeat 2 [Peptostreptococcus anaerobius VPI 4330 = DSM 2949]|nr:putative cell wall binding repeat 2 [Peptostreptococcus anaerobius VPI 4330 = DSM 2949]